MGVLQTAGEALVTALFLAVVANRLVEGLAKPLYVRYGWDTLTLMYVSWAVGAGLVALSGVNLFEAYIPNALYGQALTALVAGGGANLLNDLFGRPDVAVITADYVASEPER